MKLGGKKGKLLTIALSLFVLIAMCAGIFYHRNEKIDFRKLSMLKENKDKNASEYIKCQLFSNIGTQNYLMLEMAIPYQNKEQHFNLKNNLDRIKSDMLIHIDQKEMAEWVKERDYVAIKSEFLKVINKHTNTPIEQIYFESFLYQ